MGICERSSLDGKGGGSSLWTKARLTSQKENPRVHTASAEVWKRKNVEKEVKTFIANDEGKKKKKKGKGGTERAGGGGKKKKVAVSSPTRGEE